VILIIASRHDQDALELQRAWSQDALLVSCEDLCSPGWRFEPEQPDQAVAVCDGRKVPVDQISGVLTRRPCVLAEELLSIRREDRSYVAAEINAFLLAWLASLRCNIVNRPTPTCLSGPGWRPEQWTWAAARAGLQVYPTRRNVGAMGDRHSDDHHRQFGGMSMEGAQSIYVTIVGSECFFEGPPAIGQAARVIARAAGVDLLGLWFAVRDADYTFLGADLWPPISNDAVRRALRQLLHRQPGDLQTISGKQARWFWSGAFPKTVRPSLSYRRCRRPARKPRSWIRDWLMTLRLS